MQLRGTKRIGVKLRLHLLARRPDLKAAQFKSRLDSRAITCGECFLQTRSRISRPASTQRYAALSPEEYRTTKTCLFVCMCQTAMPRANLRTRGTSAGCHSS